jgi:predicted XRE-type DNA-binding protein
MNNLQITKLITDLENTGLTQKEIAEGIGCGISQSTVCDLKTGKLKSIRYERGVSLLALHKKHCKKAA